jgi:phage tail-like protein
MNGGTPEQVAPLPSTNGLAPLLSAPGKGDVPPSASARAVLRRGLPAIYQDPGDGFVMRFVEALEHVLDPLVAVIDCRAAYLAPDLAPEHMVAEMARWLGLEPEELPPGTARTMLANAAELARWRGTRKGIELALRCCFPDLPLQVHDGGGVLAPSEPDLRGDGWVGLSVSCSVPFDAKQRARIDRVIEGQLPLQLRPELARDDVSRAAEEMP